MSDEQDSLKGTFGPHAVERGITDWSMSAGWFSPEWKSVELVANYPPGLDDESAEHLIETITREIRTRGKFAKFVGYPARSNG